MELKNFLKNDWRRQLLCLVAEKVEKDNIERNNIDTLHSGYEILTIDEFKSYSDALSIVDIQRPFDGMLLTLSPYDNEKYIEIDKAREKLALEKVNHMINYFQLLGAKDISITNVKVIDSKEVDKAKVSGGHSAISMENDFSRSLQKELSNKLLTSVKGLPGKCEHEKAVKYLKKYNLSSDTELSNFLDFRNPEIMNRGGIFNRVITYSESVNSSISIASKVTWPVGYIKGSYEKTINTNLHISSELILNFGD